jgi:hypothetical protein
MSRTNLGLTPEQMELAHTRPLRFVTRSAYLFAGSFTYIWLVASALIPGWDSLLSASRIVFVATFGGIFGALVTLFLVRRAPRTRSA